MTSSPKANGTSKIVVPFSLIFDCLTFGWRWGWWLWPRRKGSRLSWLSPEDWRWNGTVGWVPIATVPLVGMMCIQPVTTAVALAWNDVVVFAITGHWKVVTWAIVPAATPKLGPADDTSAGYRPQQYPWCCAKAASWGWPIPSYV